MKNKKQSKKSDSSKFTSLAGKIRSMLGRLSDTRSASPHKSFSLTKKYETNEEPVKISGSIALLRQSLSFYKTHWKTFLGLTVTYIVALWVIIGLPSQEAYGDLRGLLSETLEGDIFNFVGIGTLVAGAIGGVTVVSQSELQQFMTAVAGIIFWLVFVWTVRQIQAGHKVTVRQALYNASTPLIPLLIITAIIALQMIPAAIGAFVLAYTTSSDGLGLSGVEAMLFSIGAILLILLTLYWIVQSLFALLIVTLPNMYPLTALSTAKTLVANKRFLILRRLTVFALLLGVLWLIVIIPIILLDNWLAIQVVPLVPMAVDVLSAFSLPISVIYLYRLYRELL